MTKIKVYVVDATAFDNKQIVALTPELAIGATVESLLNIEHDFDINIHKEFSFDKRCDIKEDVFIYTAMVDLSLLGGNNCVVFDGAEIDDDAATVLNTILLDRLEEVYDGAVISLEKEQAFYKRCNYRSEVISDL